MADYTTTPTEVPVKAGQQLAVTTYDNDLLIEEYISDAWRPINGDSFTAGVLAAGDSAVIIPATENFNLRLTAQGDTAAVGLTPIIFE